MIEDNSDDDEIENTIIELETKLNEDNNDIKEVYISEKKKKKKPAFY